MRTRMLSIMMALLGIGSAVRADPAAAQTLRPVAVGDSVRVTLGALVVEAAVGSIDGDTVTYITHDRTLGLRQIRAVRDGDRAFALLPGLADWRRLPSADAYSVAVRGVETRRRPFAGLAVGAALGLGTIVMCEWVATEVAEPGGDGCDTSTAVRVAAGTTALGLVAGTLIRHRSHRWVEATLPDGRIGEVRVGVAPSRGGGVAVEVRVPSDLRFRRTARPARAPAPRGRASLPVHR